MQPRTFTLPGSALLVLLLCAAVTEPAPQSDDENDSFSLNPSGGRACRTQDQRDGICVLYSQCFANFTINPYPNLDNDTDERAGTCPGRYDWCCVDEFNASPAPPPARLACATDDPCPGCVVLERRVGTDPAGGTARCAGLWWGTGARAVLAQAACVRSVRPPARLQLVHPPQPVQTAVTHPDYNSGSRAWDVALLVLAEGAGDERGGTTTGCVGTTTPQPGEQCEVRGWPGGGAVRVVRCEGAPAASPGAVCAQGEGREACGAAQGALLVCGGAVAALGSWTPGACVSPHTGVFTALSTVAPWADARLAELQLAAPA